MRLGPAMEPYAWARLWHGTGRRLGARLALAALVLCHRPAGWARFGRAPAWGYGPYAEPVTQEQEVESLKAQAGWLKEQLDAINRCLGELEKEE